MFGRVANTESVASIEYIVNAADAPRKLTAVPGHQSCGAVAAALKGGDAGTNLNLLRGHIKPAVDNQPITNPSTKAVNKAVKKNAATRLSNPKILYASSRIAGRR